MILVDAVADVSDFEVLNHAWTSFAAKSAETALIGRFSKVVTAPALWIESKRALSGRPIQSH